MPPRRQVATPSIVRVDLTPEQPLTVAVDRLPADGRAYAHMHLALEAGVLLAGQMERNHGQGWFSHRAGQAWACGSLEVHRWRVARRGTVELRFNFLPSLFTRMPDLQGFNPSAVFRSPIRSGAIGAGGEVRRSLLGLGRELAEKYRTPVTPGQAYVDLLRFLEIVGRESIPAEAGQAQPWGDLTGAQRIQPALDLIERASGRRVSVAEAARACAMSASRFARFFREVTGMGFAAFALRLRLAGAAHAVRYDTASLKAIAYRFGFRDLSHFYHVFTAHYGVAPGRYRSP
jgi:AraC-like DNA-binding protein